MPPKGTLLLEREQITREIVVAYVDCRGYEGKGVQIHKNQGQGFLLKKQVRNIQCSLYQEAQNQREGEAKREKIMRVECIKCRKRDTIVKKISEQEKRRILCLEYRVEKKKEQWNWREVVYPTEGKAQ